MPIPIILTFVSCYLPGYKAGGPVRTISNMVEQLGDELDFLIVTKDRDAQDTEPYPNVAIDSWNTVGKAKVFYASPRKLSIMNVSRLINETQHDVLYLNSFFCYPFTIRPLLARRLGLIQKRYTLIAPRGELSQASLEIKRWKKASYMPIARTLGLYCDLIWQASSDFELEDIRRYLGSSAQLIVIAPNLPALPKIEISGEQQNVRAPGEPLRVCFLSRISLEKNLDYALRVLAKVKVPIVFGIYGSVSDEHYWKRCQGLFKKLPAHVGVRYHGEVEYANVAQALSKHDLFFLPTTGENYGHVIFEALASGLPVLISDQTPWRNLEAIGVGWDLPLNDMEKFRAVIETQAGLDVEAITVQRHHVIRYAQQVALDKEVLLSNLNLFREVILRNNGRYDLDEKQKKRHEY